MNMKMPDFNVKKLVKEAGSTLSRVVQVCIAYIKTYLALHRCETNRFSQDFRFVSSAFKHPSIRTIEHCITILLWRLHENSCKTRVRKKQVKKTHTKYR